jgi:hypothetical protein
MFRVQIVASLFAVALCVSGYLLGDDKNTDKEPVIVKASLPRYFKQLGLNDRQKKQVFRVRAQYAAKIEELQRQIDALKEQEKTDLANLLTDAQKARLKELRSGTSSKDNEIKDKPAENKKK